MIRRYKESQHHLGDHDEALEAQVLGKGRRRGEGGCAARKISSSNESPQKAWVADGCSPTHALGHLRSLDMNLSYHTVLNANCKQLCTRKRVFVMLFSGSSLSAILP